MTNLDNLKTKMTEKFDEFWNTGDNWMNQQKVEHFISEQIEEAYHQGLEEGSRFSPSEELIRQAFKAGQREIIEKVEKLFVRERQVYAPNSGGGRVIRDLLQGMETLKAEIEKNREEVQHENTND